MHRTPVRLELSGAPVERSARHRSPAARLAQINLFCHIFLYRVWTLYVAHSTTDRKKRVADEGETASLLSVDKLTWKQRVVNRFKYASDSFAGWFLFFTGILAVVPVFAFTPVAAPKNGDLMLCDGCNMTPPFIFLFVEIIIYATIFIIMSFKFSKKENDNFNIKGVRRLHARRLLRHCSPLARPACRSFALPRLLHWSR